MSTIALVDKEGRPLLNEKVPTPSKVEGVEEPLWKLAQREAERQSTKAHQQEK